METSNKTLTTKNGFVVTLKPFITGRDKRHIKDSFLEDTTVYQQGSDKPSFNMQAIKTNTATDRAIQAVVVSVTGEGVDASKPVIDQVLDLPDEDYDEVML